MRHLALILIAALPCAAAAADAPGRDPKPATLPEELAGVSFKVYQRHKDIKERSGTLAVAKLQPKNGYAVGFKTPVAAAGAVEAGRCRALKLTDRPADEKCRWWIWVSEAPRGQPAERNPRCLQGPFKPKSGMTDWMVAGSGIAGPIKEAACLLDPGTKYFCHFAAVLEAPPKSAGGKEGGAGAGAGEMGAPSASESSNMPNPVADLGEEGDGEADEAPEGPKACDLGIDSPISPAAD